MKKFLLLFTFSMFALNLPAQPTEGISVHFEKALDPNIQTSLENNASEIFDAVDKLAVKLATGEIGFTDVSLSDAQIKEIEDMASWVRSNAKTFVVLGIGGSSLGGQTIISALTNEFSDKGIKIIFMDNIDAEHFSDFLESIDLKTTVFNVISKSGGTAEPGVQFFIMYKMLCDKLGKKDAISRIIFTTDPEKGAFRPLVKSMGFKALAIPQNIGGRFSALTAVGLFPAAVAGIDIKALIKGAADMAKLGLIKDLSKNPVLKYTFIKYLHAQIDKCCSVMMTYSTKLSNFSSWYVQLWGESLGKEGLGQTPVPATGAIDQHSLLQLLMAGKKDKFVTFIGIENVSNPIEIPEFEVNIEGLSYLSGRTMHELMNAEQRSTERALHENKVPSVSIDIPRLDAYHLGQLFMFFELSVAITAELMGINAFDQPAVEIGKKHAIEMMKDAGARQRLKAYVGKNLISKDDDEELVQKVLEKFIEDIKGNDGQNFLRGLAVMGRKENLDFMKKASASFPELYEPIKFLVDGFDAGIVDWEKNPYANNAKLQKLRDEFIKKTKALKSGK